MTNVVMVAPLVVLSSITLYWTTYAWHSPELHESTTARYEPGPPRFSFSVIVPLRNETYPVVSATVAHILRQSHRRIEIVISVGYDDEPTLAVARRLIEEHPGRITLAVSYSDVHNKPTQLNSALAFCTGDIVGILDAESLSAPHLFRQIDAAFCDPTTDAVQGGVAIVNHHSSWVALRSALEYFVNHRSKMHCAADRRVLLMGGNTVFFRRSVLLDVGGWDDTNLTEDAEIGLRLAALGRRIRVAYDPLLVSREEAPTTVRGWTKQRTRWNLGFAQTVRKGVWRELPTRKRRLVALWLLLQPGIVAVSGIAIPLGIATAFLADAPVWATMLAFLPLLPTILLIVLETSILHLYGQALGLEVKFRHYLLLLVTTPLYQLMSAWAALRAVVRYSRHEFAWEKTEHPGAHLDIGAARPVPA